MKPKRYRYRSAITGRYVTAAFAARNPRTTVREAIKEKCNARN